MKLLKSFSVSCSARKGENKWSLFFNWILCVRFFFSLWFAPVLLSGQNNRERENKKNNSKKVNKQLFVRITQSDLAYFIIRLKSDYDHVDMNWIELRIWFYYTDYSVRDGQWKSCEGCCYRWNCYELKQSSIVCASKQALLNAQKIIISKVKNSISYIF